jgi:hypothetical protein
MESQVLDQKSFSVSPVDLIPPDEEDDEPQVDQRCLKYTVYGPLVDKDDVKAMITARLMEHVELDHLVDDAIADPLDPDRPHVHVADQLRLGQTLVDITQDVLDEYIDMLAIAAGED